MAAGIGFAALSGQADVGVALVMAGETAYLGCVGTHPRFQNYIDVMENEGQRQTATKHSEQALKNILRSLPERLLKRFSLLRGQCQVLREIATDLKQHKYDDADSSLDSLQSAGLDRLLWVFLRLLFTQYSIERFLRNTSLENMQRKCQKLQGRLAKFTEKKLSMHQEKIRRTIEDNLKTTEGRIDNYQRAEANLQYVELELDRLENKIKSLAELAVNRQEPEYISDQIDQVAHSMMETEKTMYDLQYVTGLDEVHAEVPELMRATVKISGRK
jgi:hypothetical protein